MSLVVSLKLGLQVKHAWSKFGECSSNVTDIKSFHTKCLVVILKMCQGHLSSNLKCLESNQMELYRIEYIFIALQNSFCSLQLMGIKLSCKGISGSQVKKVGDVSGFTYFSYKM